jgi:hypothetical protein
MADDLLRQRVIPILLIAVLIVGAASLLGADLFSAVGLEEECGTGVLELEGETFSSEQELRDFLEDKEVSFETLNQEWNLYNENNQVYYERTGDKCD